MKLRWGILSTAKIGTDKVIPAIQKSINGEVMAISSRTAEKASAAAKELGIPKWYASYRELIDDDEIDAIYNPLPNHLHVEWSIEALKAGKHVLCEKPIALNSTEARSLLLESKKFPHLKLMEAFMYRFHPQWNKTSELINKGEIGEPLFIQSFFSYWNTAPDNIRNIPDYGGGALMDIGCYCIQFPRYIFGTEPKRVVSMINRDPQMKTDRHSSAILDFGDGLGSSFTCSTQMHPFQRVNILGSKGRIEIEIPVNAPADRLLKVSLFNNEKNRELFLGPADQYTNMAEAFANAVLQNKPVPTPFTDAVSNMKVIDALFESEKQNGWVEITGK